MPSALHYSQGLKSSKVVEGVRKVKEKAKKKLEITCKKKRLMERRGGETTNKKSEAKEYFLIMKINKLKF